MIYLHVATENDKKMMEVGVFSSEQCFVVRFQCAKPQHKQV